jgi:sulfonate transport system permease protein
MSEHATLNVMASSGNLAPRAPRTAEAGCGITLMRVEPAPRRRHGLPRFVRRAGAPILLVLLWDALSVSGVLPEAVLAGPRTVLSSTLELLTSGELQAAMWASLRRALGGLLIGGSIGVALATLSGLSRFGEDMIDSTVQMLRTIPNVALIPLLIIWFGIGEAPKIALIAIATAFPLYINVYAGIRNVDANLVEAGRTLGLSNAGLVRHVVLPGALPNALVGLRYSLAVAWLALVFGERVNATAGIGYLMSNAREFFQTQVIVVCLVVYALLGLGVDLTIWLLERVLLSWRPSFTGT